MSEIPNLKKIYEDETGIVYLLDSGTGWSLHAEVIPTTNREILAHYSDVMQAIYQQLKEKGWTEVMCWAQTDEEYRFAEFFGFRGTGNEVTLPGWCGAPIYELKKEL